MVILLLLQFLLSYRAGASAKALVCEASTFHNPVVPGAQVVEIVVEERHNVTSRGAGPIMPSFSDLNFCEVKVYLTHPGANDKVLVETWLPISSDAWNGRFQGVGGGGFSTGMFDFGLGGAINAGYAASSTDGGHPVDFFGADWVVKEDSSANWELLQNFAWRSLGDMIYVGKGLTEQFFGEKPHHSYWNGCSQGGRQGHVIAQRYPELLDGVLAAAPALRLTGVFMNNLWPLVLMNEADTLVSNCELDYFQAKAVEECDLVDGALDGVIGDPDACTFDPQTLVGNKIDCSGHQVEITAAAATIARKIKEGARTPFGGSLYPGFSYGSSLATILNVTIDSEGVRTMHRSAVFDAWPQIVLLKDRTFNTTSLTYVQYIALLAQTNSEHGWLFDTYESDLSGFRNAGGKLLSWHGLTDERIPYETTTIYRDHVVRGMGGAKAVNEFYRLFLAPGVEHCGMGTGAWPRDPLSTLVDWVEKGEAPATLEAETIDAEGELVTRNLCLYPSKLKYMGVGSAKRASSWSCEGAEEDNEEEAILEEKGFVGGLKDRLMQVGLGMGLKVEDN